MRLPVFILLMMTSLTSVVRADIVLAYCSSDDDYSTLNNWIACKTSDTAIEALRKGLKTVGHPKFSDEESLALMGRPVIKLKGGLFELDQVLQNPTEARDSRFRGETVRFINGANESRSESAGGMRFDIEPTAGNTVIHMTGRNTSGTFGTGDRGTYFVMAGRKLVQRSAVGSTNYTGYPRGILIEGRGIRTDGSTIVGEIVDLSGTFAGFLSKEPAKALRLERQSDSRQVGISRKFESENDGIFWWVLMILPCVVLVQTLVLGR